MLPIISSDPTFVTVCRVGAKYNKDHVRMLKEQFDRHCSNSGFKFACLTDKPEDPWDYELVTDWQRWWSTLEALRFVGPTVKVDLDIIIRKDITLLLQLALNCPKNVFKGARGPGKALIPGIGRSAKSNTRWPGGGVYCYNGNYLNIIDGFKPTRAIIKKFYGDMEFLSNTLDEHSISRAYFDEEIDGICSYKMNIRPALIAVLEGTKSIEDVMIQETSRNLIFFKDVMLIYFHGHPTPWEIERNIYDLITKQI